MWSNKPNKVRRKTIIADYGQGGLKMLDVKSFLKAQKVMWVKRLISPEAASWKAVPLLYLDTFLGVDTFKCSMTCKVKPHNFPTFYWQILLAWFEVKRLTKVVETPLEVRKECLWFNQDIKMQKNEIHWHEWSKNGINTIHDIINQDGKFLTASEIEAKYNVKCDALKFNSLKDVIPERWRKIVKTQVIADEDLNFADNIISIMIGKVNKVINMITNKDIYWVFIENIRQKAIIIDKLNSILKLEDNEWEDIFTMSKVVRNSKIRAFQYKVLFNLIPCNLYLFRIERSLTDKCLLCHQLDDIFHYLYQCDSVKGFWNSFSTWWNNMTGQNIQLDIRLIMVGFTGQSVEAKTINACLLMAKWHLYKCKLNEDSVFLYKFLCELKYSLIVEKTIALREGRLVKYNEMWQDIENYLT